jgi:hypothetical protein
MQGPRVAFILRTSSPYERTEDRFIAKQWRLDLEHNGVEEDEMGGACSTNGGEEERV